MRGCYVLMLKKELELEPVGSELAHPLSSTLGR